MVILESAAEHVAFEWGHLEWMASRAIGNSTTMTFGRCYIAAGAANGWHYHPNCDEILHVIAGSIEHSLGDSLFAMTVGDTISIPAGVVHNARNIGDSEAVMTISFSSADRQSVAVEQ